MELSKKSMERLEGVDARLKAVVLKCAEDCPFPFNVSEGLRTEERQLEMYKLGISKTLQSKHLIGYAVDLYPLTMDRMAVDWDGFGRLADLMFKAADAVGARIVWGGNWKRFVDKPHFELTI